MHRDESVYLRHILDAVVRIDTYPIDVSEDNFRQNTLLQDGVIRQIEIIGEATKRLTSDLRGRYPQIPWEDIASMRDKIIHDYFGVDFEKVWLTATEDIPVLKREIAQILTALS